MDLSQGLVPSCTLTFNNNDSADETNGFGFRNSRLRLCIYNDLQFGYQGNHIFPEHFYLLLNVKALTMTGLEKNWRPPYIEPVTKKDSCFISANVSPDAKSQIQIL